MSEEGPLRSTSAQGLPDDELLRPDQTVFPSSTSDVSTPDINYNVRSANIRAGLDPDAYLDIEPTCAEAEWAAHTSKLLDPELERITLAVPKRISVTKCYLANKKTVIETSTDMLTAAEMNTRRTEVAAAVVSELQT